MMSWPKTYQVIFLCLVLLTALFSVWWVLHPDQGHLQVLLPTRWRGWAHKPKLHNGWGLSPLEARVAMDKRLQVWDVEASNCTADLLVMEKAWVRHLDKHILQFLLYRHCRYFPILRNHPEKCAGDIYLLVVVKSFLTRQGHRDVIRKTWGREREADGSRGAIRTLFLLGTDPRRDSLDVYQQLLNIEDRIYQDILQWDFHDSFFNLTLKEVNFLKWLEIFCPRVSFIFKGDDDVFVSPANLLEFLKDHRPQENLLAGDVVHAAIPIRTRESKYYVPRVLYSQNYYPTYVTGGGFLMTRRLAHRLHLASQTLELFPIDDVFLGMCLKALAVKPMSHRAFKSFGILPSSQNSLNKDPCVYRSMIMVHRIHSTEMLNMWELVHSRLNCSQSFRFFSSGAREEKNPQHNMGRFVILYILLYLVFFWAQK